MLSIFGRYGEVVSVSVETADFQSTGLNAFDKLTGQQKNTRARR
jgi:hypothetical protein